VNRTKASRLAKLLKSDLSEYVLEQIVIRREIFESMTREEFVNNVNFTLPLVVRSSSIDEDQAASNAGKFDSALNVPLRDAHNATQTVFDSYENKYPNDEVLIQEFLSNTNLSGVIFTADPNTGSPYFVINYHEGSDTTAITSGSENGHTLVVARNSDADLHVLSEAFKLLVKVAIRAEEILNEGHLDIEFAFAGPRLTILQARPLYGGGAGPDLSIFGRTLSDVHEKLLVVDSPHPDLFGEQTMFSVMADWNPAELIGVRPNQLSISLFRELISDSIWAYERSNFGYRNLRSFPLVLELGGHPYVDYRVSFNSLIPNKISTKSGDLLAKYYLETLAANPQLHDKVEFEIYFASWNLQTKSRLSLAGFPIEVSNEVEIALKNLTSQVLRSNPYGLRQSVDKSHELQKRFESINRSNLPLISKIFWLIEDCKRHGTLPFAGIARCAFIATDLLRSLVSAHFLSQESYDSFFSGLTTVTSEIQRDSLNLSPELFKIKYGHLRPGTFDINSATYAENYDLYFGRKSDLQHQILQTGYEELSVALAESRMAEILNCSPEDIILFLRESIRLREVLKFQFSKNISRVLELIEELGTHYGLSRKEMSYVNIGTVLGFYYESGNEELLLREDLVSGLAKEAVAQSLWLPPLIVHASDILAFELPETHPNFVSQNKFSGEVSGLTGDLTGKAILIESADPGFDWIFLHEIGSLITCYGGANSHMAVRCKELGIPAAIGVGEEMFVKLTKSRSVYLDCANKVLEIVK
jgi:phosphohistidine swiveling domain-containing protein